MNINGKPVTQTMPNVKDSSRPRYYMGKDGNVLNHQRKPYPRYLIEGVNHTGGKPIRFKSLDSAQRYMDNRR